MLLPLLAVLVGVVVLMIVVQSRHTAGTDGVRTVDAADPVLRITLLEREVRRLHDEVRGSTRRRVRWRRSR